MTDIDLLELTRLRNLDKEVNELRRQLNKRDTELVKLQERLESLENAASVQFLLELKDLLEKHGISYCDCSEGASDYFTYD